MGNKKGKKKKQQQQLLVENDEDADMDIEDVDMNAITDSDEEYTESEKKLLEKVRKRRTSENFDSDDEVYGVQVDSEEDEEDDQDDLQESMESDIEGLQEDDDLPDDRAWGKNVKNFYSSEYKYTDYSSATQKDLINAELEEQEAKKLHIRAVNEIFDIADDRFTQILKDSKNHQNDEEVMEFKLSNKEKYALEQKESRAFKILINDFKECMTEVKQNLLPFLRIVKNGMYPDCDAAVFVKTKYEILLNYCINISFFLMLKAQGLLLQSHPVVKRLEQYRQLLSRLKLIEGNLSEEVAGIVKAVKKGKPLYDISTGSPKVIKEKSSSFFNSNKRLVSQKTVLQHKKDQLLFDSTVMNNVNKDLFTEELNDDEDKKDINILDDTNEEEERRAITYEMAKNRGLTPYRKKELRNPRVKLRNKYRKAKIRRKGAVREVRKELVRYAGEVSGIKAGVTKSIKLK